jgi:hypothetical protein
MWSPEIDRMCWRLEMRSASVVSASMVERTPVVIAAAKPPAGPGIVSMISCVTAMRMR